MLLFIMTKINLRQLLAIALIVACQPLFAQDAALDQARKLIDAKQPQAAFALLAPLEADRAGNPDFDFLLGLSAIDSGHLTRAVFALERVLAARPNDPRVRAEIARAYFLMGEGENAKREFAAVKAANPPAEVAATIDRFLGILDIRGDRPPNDREGFTGFLEGGLGYDSNANAATSSGSFAIPLFPGAIFNLAAGATSSSDEFLTLAGGITGRKFLSPSVTLFGTGSFDRRMNFSLDRFDTGSLSGSVGLTIERNADEFTIAAQAQAFDVDDRRFRDATGLIGQWRRNLSPFDQLTGYVQYTQLRYAGQGQRNANRRVAGAAWAHAWDHPRSPVLFASLYLGDEDERTAGVPHFGHNLVGGRIGGQIDLTKAVKFTANLSYEDRRYGGPDPLFLTNRHDKETGLRFSMPWEIARNWTLTPQLSYSDNRSNIIVSDYRRTQAYVTLRHDFR